MTSTQGPFWLYSTFSSITVSAKRRQSIQRKKASAYYSHTKEKRKNPLRDQNMSAKTAVSLKLQHVHTRSSTVGRNARQTGMDPTRGNHATLRAHLSCAPLATWTQQPTTYKTTQISSPTTDIQTMITKTRLDVVRR